MVSPELPHEPIFSSQAALVGRELGLAMTHTNPGGD